MSKKKITFTDMMLKKLKPQDKKYIRSEGNGFTIVVWPTGKKTWRYRYTFDGKSKEMHLGEFPDVSQEAARQKFEDARRQVKNNIDPMAIIAEQRIERNRTPTIAKFVDEYINTYAKIHLKSWEKVDKTLKREIVPVLGDRKITDIRRRDMAVIFNEVAARAPVMANRLLAYVRQMFSWAVDQDVLESNPLAGMKRPGGKEESRERSLSPAEIKSLWHLLDSPLLGMTNEMRRAIKLILVTAQRPGEVISMHAQNLNGNWWTIPGGRVGRTKNQLTHRVYLTKLALSLIGDISGKGYIFRSPLKDIDKPMTESAINYAIRRMLNSPLEDSKKNIHFGEHGNPVTENRVGIEHFTPHDLRRTATTLMAQAKIIKEHRDRVTNHKLEKMDGTYNLHDYDDEKQIALEELEMKLNCILSGKDYQTRQQRELDREIELAKARITEKSSSRRGKKTRGKKST